MTGGVIVCLGETGVNFGAGMSGGVGYIYDPLGTFPERCNMEMVELERVGEGAEADELRGHLQAHAEKTGSSVATGLLSDWSGALPKFVKVFPTDYKRVLQERAEEEAAAAQAEAATG